ncbi:hypothetical protein IWX76_003205 [Pedobacter sp. CAN_A7]|uniref:hypothetical protein n=1 Tax=Pedobacter sp. CAN_A7 TaxID=2787722 RepID=UPI0018CB8B4A
MQTSLIIGTSRSAQGILPHILNKELGRNDIYNYSFTVSHSPYGPVYLKSIEQKLQKNSKNGLFILAVDPWSISSTGANPNDESSFNENDLFLADLRSVTLNPNFEYLIKYYDDNYFSLIYNHKKKTFLHENGWLEVNVNIENKKSIDNSTKNKIEEYRKDNLPRYKFSKKRFEYLKYTIERLKSHGMVYLVRLPIHSEMMEIEDKLMPDFNLKLQDLATIAKVEFLDLTPINSTFEYTDGNHLYKTSGKQVTKILADWIKKTDQEKSLSITGK